MMLGDICKHGYSDKYVLGIVVDLKSAFDHLSSETVAIRTALFVRMGV